MKLWPVCAVALGFAPVPALAADANLFDVWSFDRYGDGMTPNSNDLPGRLWVPDGPAPEGGYTLVTVLHGFGERGSVFYNSTTQTFLPGYNTAQVNSNINNLFSAAQSRGFIFYAPQAWGGWGGDNYNMAANQMAKIMREYNVDPTRVYVTGLSNGGRGTLEMASIYDDVFAAALAICPQVTNWNPGQTIANPDVLADLPLWMLHARNDGTVDVSASRNGVNLIRNEKGLSSLAFPNKNDGQYPANYYPGGKNEYDDGLLRYTEYEEGGHGIWGTAYGRSDVYDWMFSYTKHNPQHLQIGETLRFDLGANSITTDAQGNIWNSTNYGLSQTMGIVRAFAMTEEGRRTAITLDVTNTFQGDSTSQPAGLEPAGSDAWFVQNFGGQDGLGEITLTGLTEGGLYDLELFGSSTNAGTVRYIINGIEKLLNFQNNLSNTVTFDDVVSLDGTLTIQVRAVGATYAYLNWFTITAVPEPTTVALLATSLLLLPRRRAA